MHHWKEALWNYLQANKAMLQAEVTACYLDEIVAFLKTTSVIHQEVSYNFAYDILLLQVDASL